MGGIKAYHDPLDKYETLPLNKLEDLQNMLIELIRNYRKFTFWILLNIFHKI